MQREDDQWLSLESLAEFGQARQEVKIRLVRARPENSAITLPRYSARSTGLPSMSTPSISGAGLPSLWYHADCSSAISGSSTSPSPAGTTMSTIRCSVSDSNAIL